MRAFLASIAGSGDASPQGDIHYKTANTDIAAWVCEQASGQSLRMALLDVIEAAGMEDSVYISTDREGVPFLGGGLHMTLRDVARIGRLLCFDDRSDPSRRYLVHEALDSPTRGTRYADGTSYRNFFETDGRFVGHLGYGGQYLYVAPEQGLVVAAFNAIEDEVGLDYGFVSHIRSVCAGIARMIG